jgi:hypothetical protein
VDIETTDVADPRVASYVRWVRVALVLSSALLLVWLALWCWYGIRVEVDMDPVERAWRRWGQTGLDNAVAISSIALAGVVELAVAVVAAGRHRLPRHTAFALGLSGVLLIAAPWLLWRLWEDVLLPLPEYVPSCC